MYYFLLFQTIQKVMGTGNEDYAPKDDEAGHDTLMYQELFNQKQRYEFSQSSHIGSCLLMYHYLEYY